MRVGSATLPPTKREEAPMANVEKTERAGGTGSDLRARKLLLAHGAGQIPALGFGTLIPLSPDPALTTTATAVLTTPKTAARARENFDISALPEDALEAIDGIQIRQRLNDVVKTGVPGFIPQRR